MDVATILFWALLTFHSRWQDTACDHVGEGALTHCESLRERGQNALKDFTRSLSRACEDRPGTDCMLLAMVAEKESSIGDLGNDVAFGSSEAICRRYIDRDNIVGEIEEREGTPYCESRITWKRHGSTRTTTRNVHIVTSNDQTIRVDTCCARERGYFQLLPNDFQSGRRVRLPVADGCGEYDGDENYCRDGQFVFPRSPRERYDLIDRVEWNVAVGADEVNEHLALCHLQEDDHPLLAVAAYNQGDCVHDDGFETYFYGVRSRYRRACDAVLPDGSKVSDHWDGCNNIPDELE